MDKASLIASLDGLDKWLIFFGVLVAIGVVGESIVGFLHWRGSSQLQTIQTAENLALLKEVRKADRKAAEAQLALEEYKAGRSLSEEQSRTIVAALRGKISIKVNVQSDPPDVEAYPFAQQILEALKSAAVDAQYQPWPTTFMWLTRPGVFVVTGGEVDEKQTALIVEALNSAGLQVERAKRPDDMSPKPPNPGWVSVLVWRRR